MLGWRCANVGICIDAGHRTSTREATPYTSAPQPYTLLKPEILQRETPRTPPSFSTTDRIEAAPFLDQVGSSYLELSVLNIPALCPLITIFFLGPASPPSTLRIAFCCVLASRPSVTTPTTYAPAPTVKVVRNTRLRVPRKRRKPETGGSKTGGSPQREGNGRGAEVSGSMGLTV